jgi:acetyl esterase/lipase
MRGVTVLGLVAVLAAALPAGAQADCVPSSARTVAYRSVPGVSPAFVSLDLHVPPARCRRRAAVPVVAWVHGGGYRVGDKSQQIAHKVALFARRGWIFASINYRLSRPGAGSARFPDHYDDVAAAVAWLRKNVRRRGGDPGRIALLGHSAGADIVSNVAVNPRYLRAHRRRLGSLRCFAPLDTAGFDKPRASPREQVQWQVALGNLPDYMTATSATLIARRGAGIPPVFTIYRGTPRRQRIETAFAERLRALGVPATLVDARTLNHQQVNARIGAPGDRVMTPPLVAFLRRCFKP